MKNMTAHSLWTTLQTFLKHLKQQEIVRSVISKILSSRFSNLDLFGLFETGVHSRCGVELFGSSLATGKLREA